MMMKDSTQRSKRLDFNLFERAFQLNYLALFSVLSFFFSNLLDHVLIFLCSLDRDYHFNHEVLLSVGSWRHAFKLLFLSQSQPFKCVLCILQELPILRTFSVHEFSERFYLHLSVCIAPWKLSKEVVVDLLHVPFESIHEEVLDEMHVHTVRTEIWSVASLARLDYWKKSGDFMCYLDCILKVCLDPGKA